MKTVLITGAYRGLGYEVARILSLRAWKVILTARHKDKGAAAAANLDNASFLELDITDDDSVARAAKRVANLDVLINNAGRPQPKGITELTEGEWNATIDVNLKSCFNWIQPVVPHMLAARYGRIVSMSSLNAHSGGVTAAVSKFAYAAAKAGIIGMTRSLAKELGPHILVNCVCPGLIKTEVGRNAVIREREPELVKGIALNRVGTPRDVGEVVAFLAASEPCFVTGQDIIIDGLQWNQ